MCEVPHTGINITAAIFMVLIPLLVLVAFKVLPSLGEQLDWHSTRRLADVVYLGSFLYVMLEAERFGDVVCQVTVEGPSISSGTSSFESNQYKATLVEAVQCRNLGCEVLFDDNNEACDVCESHLTAGAALMTIAWITQAATTLLIAVLSSKTTPTIRIFTTYKVIHAVNAVVWLIVGYTVQFYRCDCRWSWATNVTTAFMAPLAAILFVLTHEAQRGFYEVGQTAVLAGIEKKQYQHLNGKQVVVLSEPNLKTGRREVVLVDDLPDEHSTRLSQSNGTLTDLSFVEEGQRKSIKMENLTKQSSVRSNSSKKKKEKKRTSYIF